MRGIAEKYKQLRMQLESGEPLKVGRALTKIFLFAIFALALLPQKTESGWSIRIVEFLLAPANEIGDTLAGIAGVLAFLWIIVTVWLQSQELAAQREELELTRKEFSKMALAQEKQVASLEVQGEIFREEQTQRAEDRAGATLERLLDGLAYSIDREAKESSLLGNLPSRRLHIFHERFGQEVDAYLADSSRLVQRFWFRYNGEFAEGEFEGWVGYYEDIREILNRISTLEPELSNDDKQRLDNVNFKQLLEDINEFIDIAPWGDYSGEKPEFLQ